MGQEEGVALFRVLSNKAIEDIATVKPKTKEDLMLIRGIKEKKFAKYGMSILFMVNEDIKEGVHQEIEEKTNDNTKPFTVSAYLNFLNIKLGTYKARVLGEISSTDIRNKCLYFSIKDKEESVLSCFMWKSDYELCGVSLEEGVEIIADGFPEIYKPNGRLSFKVSTIELIGEGALKDAYDKLKKKLENEGLFAVERKKIIPDFPQKIGLITSETGAVIHDFLNNLGKYGYHIKLIDSRVEGQIAIQDLVSAIDYFNKQEIDSLVIIRGGGSMESLQAFNNEVLVRKIAAFNVPVICGVGHDKDVPLACLAADKAVSTATAVAVFLNRSWDKASDDIAIFEKDILYKYKELLEKTRFYLESLSNQLGKRFGSIINKCDDLKHKLRNASMSIEYTIENTKKTLDSYYQSFFASLKRSLEKDNNILNDIEGRLKVADPVRQLQLGYSIVSAGGKIIKSINQVSKGEELDTQISDGRIKSQVKDISNQKG